MVDFDKYILYQATSIIPIYTFFRIKYFYHEIHEIQIIVQIIKQTITNIQ